MAIDPLVAAKFVCETGGWKVSNLSLQKILYFSHLAYLGRNGGVPLFDETFESWEMGPVLRSVYTHAKQRDVEKEDINEGVFCEIKTSVANDNDKELQALKFFSKNLSQVDPFKLKKWSHHDEGAWKKSYVDKQKNPIDNKDIKTEYGKRLLHNNEMGKLIKNFISLNNLIVALDFSNLQKAGALVEKLENRVAFFKIGLEIFFQKGGVDFAKELQKKGNKIFFDAKALDIPRTVEAAIRSVSELHFDFMSVHTLSHSLLKHLGERTKQTKPRLIGVTLLTSVNDEELRTFGIQQSAEKMVLTLAKQAMEVGNLDGLVASGREVASLRKKYPDAILMTPGIRPRGAEAHDQRRTTTAYEAVVAGADHVVVGRPITQAEDPCSAVEHILAEIEQGVQERELAKQREEKHEQKGVAR